VKKEDDEDKKWRKIILLAFLKYTRTFKFCSSFCSRANLIFKIYVKGSGEFSLGGCRSDVHIVLRERRCGEAGKWVALAVEEFSLR
jgi:hypothetical protein